MSWYNPFTWVEKQTQVGPTRMNALEAAVADASEHHKSDTYGNIPPANAASRGWTFWATDRGVLYANFDGATWTRIGPGTPGGIEEYGGLVLPTGYLWCDGTSYLGSTYPDLYSAMTYNFSANTTVGTPTLSNVPAAVFNYIQKGMTVYAGLGGVNGFTVSSTNPGASTITLSGNATSTQAAISIFLAPWGMTASAPQHFNVPDFRDYVALGADKMGDGAAAGRLSATNTRPPGGSGGEETHVLSIAEMPAHTHPVGAPYTTSSGSTISGSGIPPHNGIQSSGNWGSTATTTGGGGAHNNMPPFAVVTKIIKT